MVMVRAMLRRRGKKYFPELKKYFPGIFFALTTTRVNVHLSHTCNIYRVFVSVAFLPGKCFFRSGQYFCLCLSRSSPLLGNGFSFPMSVERVQCDRFHFPGVDMYGFARQKPRKRSSESSQQVAKCYHSHLPDIYSNRTSIRI